MRRSKEAEPGPMDRRRFLAKAGLLAAGSAIGPSLLGCGEVNVDIPCIGPAQPPVPVPGMTYIRASQIGCALDCNLENGSNKHTGGAATDDAPRINAAMAGASATNPITLIIDGSALISGLFLPAGGYWSIAGLGCGTGFFIKTGANNDGIHNGPPDASNPSDPGPPAPPRGMNVSLTNFAMNGNQGDGSNGDSTTGKRQGRYTQDWWFFCVNLMNLNNITIQNLVIVNSPAYHIRLSNVGNIAVSGCVMKSLGGNTDGLHFDGPANDITISNCDFTMGDDAIALNCPEGYTGNISRVAVTNCKFNSVSLMRLLTMNWSNDPYRFIIDTVTVSNCTGTLIEAGFLLGAGAGSIPNSVTSLAVSDCTLTTPAVVDVSANFGTIAFKNVTFIPYSYQPPGYAFVRTSLSLSGMTYVGSSLSFDHCTVARNSNVAVSALILQNASTVNNLEFDGYSMLDPAGRAYSQVPELLNIISGSIGQLTIDSLNSAHIEAPVSAGGFSSISSVGGAGLLATAWEFPDSVMANGSPYISSNSGRPSIKVDGVVQPYP